MRKTRLLCGSHREEPVGARLRGTHRMIPLLSRLPEMADRVRPLER